MCFYSDIDALRDRPATTAARIEARDDHLLAQQESADAAFEAALERAAEDMAARDVFTELCEFDAERLAKLMDAYRERNRNKDHHRWYLWELENLFEDGANQAARSMARGEVQQAPTRVRLWDED